MNFSKIKDQIFLSLLVVAALLTGCQEKSTNSDAQLHLDTLASSDTLTTHLKPFDPSLPTIGLLMYNGVLQSEVVATSDVFAKLSEDGQQLFNVITIAETTNPITTEEGLRLLPDYTFENSPKLTAIFVPSAYDMWSQVHNEKIVNFIKEKNKEVDFVVSNCGGAQLIGESGIADGHKIVTWIGGGPDLQKEYPNLLVQDENEVTYIRDGRFLSSNGNLASYISALELLEIMSSPEHRKFVESYLYLDRLQNWGR